jgi:hypothetical protein
VKPQDFSATHLTGFSANAEIREVF